MSKYIQIEKETQGVLDHGGLVESLVFNPSLVVPDLVKSSDPEAKATLKLRFVETGLDFILDFTETDGASKLYNELLKAYVAKPGVGLINLSNKYKSTALPSEEA